jgi:hypothetical protein
VGDGGRVRLFVDGWLQDAKHVPVIPNVQEIQEGWQSQAILGPSVINDGERLHLKECFVTAEFTTLSRCMASPSFHAMASTSP